MGADLLIIIIIIIIIISPSLPSPFPSFYNYFLTPVLVPG
jgi:hypothetical protein